ncbi:MAG: response regulator [Methanoregula sp.]|nr:response regulator [Methanoregula sp.]
MTDTILIVDDSSFIVDGLVAILKKSYRPLAVYGGQQCLDLLQKEKPAIIILDIMMEPMDGWETLARIKENPATRHIPVLMFSAKKISADEAEEHRINIDDFVSKPVNTKKLIEAIEKVLARQKANRQHIESWKSAGIGQQRIDEFTSLMTNLDVDMSLLQNMKVQLSLVHEDDKKSRTDFETVIAAIESRIQEEHLHEKELSNELQKSVAKDTEQKERAGPIPVMNGGAPGILPADSRTEPAVQQEFTDSYGIFNGQTNSSATEVPFTDGNASQEITVKQNPKIPEVHLPDSSLPDTAIIPETTDSDFLFEPESSEQLPLKKPEQEMVGESPFELPVSTPALSELSLSIEIPKSNPVTSPLSSETPEGNLSGKEHVSLENKVPVSGKKSPVYPLPPPVSAKTPEKKLGAMDTQKPNVAGSGTDISSRISLANPRKSKGLKIDNPFLPENKVASSSGGFFSKIISMIIGIFKRR